MKIIHTADNHLGANLYGKLRDFYLRNFEKLILETILLKKNNPEEDLIIVFAGDLFDTDTPDIGCINLVNHSLKLLKENGIIILGLFGNHDKWNPKFQMSALNIYEKKYKFKLDELNVFGDTENLFDAYSTGKPVNFKINNVNIVLQSYLPDPNILKKSMNEECVALTKKDCKNLLFSHFALKEVFSFGNENISVDELPTKHFDYIGLGDIHGGENMEWAKGNCTIMYCGATFHTNIGEMQKTEPRYLILTPNKKIDIDIKLLENIKITHVKTEEDITENITNSIVLLEDSSLLYKCYFRFKPIHVKFVTEKVSEDGTKEEIISVSNINNIEKNIVDEMEMDPEMKKFIKILLNKNLSDVKKSLLISDIKTEFETISL